MSIYARALAAIGLVLALAGAPVSVEAAPLRTAAANGFSQIAGCISGADNLLVSVVVDESLSLRQTDPKSLRVQGITTALDSLEQLSATVDDSTSVEVSMSTFARSYETLVDWQRIDANTAQEMRTTAARTLPARDAGDATDYRQALLGAKRQLDARQHKLGDPNACKLLLWFTDGALDVDAQTQTASQELCQVGGIADAVRDDGIAVVALALFTPGAGVTQTQRDQLRALAEGRGNGTTCGSTPIPLDSATGVYLPADDPAALQRLFAGAGALVAGGTEIGTVSCPGRDCAGGKYRLDVDKGVAGARVLVQTANAPRVAITSPSGQRLELVSGQGEQVEGATVSYLARDRLATINISFDPYTDSRSRWTISPAGRSEISAYWFWGAHLALDTTQIRAGASNDVALHLEDQNGAPLPASLYRNALAKVTVGGREVAASLTPSGELRGRLDLGTRDLPANVPVTASLTMRSTPSHVLLGPISLSDRVPVTLPPSYPSVSPKELDFGHLEGIGTTSAALRLTGSELGPTKVCVTGSSVTVPGGRPQDLIRPGSECVQLNAHESKTLDLDLAPGSTADGVATGEVRLRMSAADGSADLDLTVPTRLEMARHVDEGTRWALIAALLGLALLIPALLLVGSNLLLARFRMSSTSRTAFKSVQVTSTGLRPLSGTALLEPEDFENAPFGGVRRGGRMSIEGTGITLKARRIFSLKEPQGVATGPTGQLLVSSVMPYRGKALNEAPAALSEVDATFVIVNPSRATPSEADATLVMVVPDGVNRQGIHDRARRMSSVPDWEKLLAEVAELTGSQSPSKVDATVASGERTSGVSPRSAANEEGAPDLPPWDWAGATDAIPAQEAPQKTRFRRSRKPRRSPTSSPTSPTRQDDDELPPLPDFLK